MSLPATALSTDDAAMEPSLVRPLLALLPLPPRGRYRLSHEVLDLAPGVLLFIDCLLLAVSIIYVFILSKTILIHDTVPLHSITIITVAMLTPVIFLASGLYKVKILFSSRDTMGALVRAFVSLAIAMLLICFATGTLDFTSALWGGVWLSSCLLIFLGSRLTLTRVIAALMRQGALSDSVAIVGAGPLADRLVEHLTTLNLSRADGCPVGVVGIFDDRRDRHPAGCLPAGGTLDDLIALGKEGAFERVVLTLPWSAEHRLAAIRNKLQALAIDVSLCPDGFAFSALAQRQSQVRDLPFYPLAVRPLRGWNAISKRSEDIVLASIALFCLGPLMCFIALAVKLDSPGPALFRQRRHGFNNREIEVYKFRSMRTDTTDAGGGIQARRGDSRVTRLGRILRRTSIDELPQLLNVLKGDMSLVGPRPHPIGMKTQDKLCHEIVETYVHRHRVRPGITGWAQVNGCRGATMEPEQLIRRVEYDLHYIENWSILFDLQIMLKTTTSLISTENAF